MIKLSAAQIQWFDINIYMIELSAGQIQKKVYTYMCVCILFWFDIFYCEFIKYEKDKKIN